MLSLKIMSSLKTMRAGCVLGLAIASLATGALADPMKEITAASSAWADALAADTPDKVMALYADDAVLWGTLSPKIRADREAMLDYFTGGFKALPKRTVAFGDQLIRFYGNTAINSGYYTFSYVKDGETKQLPARYSFTYVKDGDKWLIVDHHSSAMPQPPK